MPRGRKASNGERLENKSEAIRRALGTGLESPKEIVEYVRKEYGLDVTPNAVSMIKSKWKKDKRRAGRKAKASGGTTGISMEDLESFVTMTKKLGSNAVKKLANLFG
jgi:hypothetical protein